MSCKTFPCRKSPTLPINIKGFGRLSIIQSIKYNLPFILSLLFVSPTQLSPNPNWCSSLVSATFEDILGGLPTLGQPKVRLPWWGPSRVSVRRSPAICPAQTGLTGPLDRSDRSVRGRGCVLRFRALKCLVCPVFTSAHFLATPLGNKKKGSAAMANLPKPGEVDADNIARPTANELRPFYNFPLKPRIVCEPTIAHCFDSIRKDC